MCSRFELDAKTSEIKQRFSVAGDLSKANKIETRPTDLAVVIDPSRVARLLIWGFAASWDGKPLFNGRAETLTDKPSFQPYLQSRCIIPATMFPEWRKGVKSRHRNRIFLNNQDKTTFMGFAGLMSDTHFTIITCAANAIMAPVHDRMPVILSPDAEQTWLDRSLSFNTASSVLKPYALDDLCVMEDQTAPSPQGELFL
jgi:putative SOS response-associated peptidase YedK